MIRSSSVQNRYNYDVTSWRSIKNKASSNSHFCTKTRKRRILQQGAGEAHSTHLERQHQPNRFSEFSFCSKRSINPSLVIPIVNKMSIKAKRKPWHGGLVQFRSMENN